MTRSAHYMVHPSVCCGDEPSLVEKINFLLQVGMKETLESIEVYTE